MLSPAERREAREPEEAAGVTGAPAGSAGARDVAIGCHSTSGALVDWVASCSYPRGGGGTGDASCTPVCDRAIGTSPPHAGHATHVGSSPPPQRPQDSITIPHSSEITLHRTGRVRSPRPVRTLTPCGLARLPPNTNDIDPLGSQRRQWLPEQPPRRRVPTRARGVGPPRYNTSRGRRHAHQTTRRAAPRPTRARHGSVLSARRGGACRRARCLGPSGARAGHRMLDPPQPRGHPRRHPRLSAAQRRPVVRLGQRLAARHRGDAQDLIDRGRRPLWRLWVAVQPLRPFRAWS